MEDLNEVALAYYESGTDEERRLFDQFFESMDEDGNGRVSYREFSEFMSLEAYDRNMCTRDFFNDLDVDGSRGLDFNEVLTLYYIIKSGRPICRQCKIFITNEYFTCTKCFKTRSFPYNICLECFRDEEGHFNHTHSLEQFVDNFALLECLRKEALEEDREDEYYEPSPSRSRSQRIVPYSRYPSENSSYHAIFPYNPNIPAERRRIDGEQHLEYWKLDFTLQVLLLVAQLCEAYTLQSSNVYRRVAGQMQSIPIYTEDEEYKSCV